MFSDKQLTAFNKQLMNLKKELQHTENMANKGAETVELDQTRVGRLSRMDALQGQAMSQESNRRRNLQLKNIDAALNRIDTGDYGYCLDCGEGIAIERLEIDPSIPLCINCASKAEKTGSKTN